MSDDLGRRIFLQALGAAAAIPTGSLATLASSTGSSQALLSAPAPTSTQDLFGLRWSELISDFFKETSFLDSIVDGTAPPSNDMLWLDRNTDPAVLKEWNPLGRQWEKVSLRTLFGRLFSDRSITTPNIVDKAVTPAKLADGLRDFPVEESFRSANIPLTLQLVKTAGYYEAGDGGGHLKKRINRPEYPQPWQMQSSDGSWWEIAEDRPNVLQFGVKFGIAHPDNDDRLDSALKFAEGGELLFPNKGEPYFCTRTHIIPPGTTLVGEGRCDYWDKATSAIFGTTIKTSGAGNASRWTDIDGNDDPDDTPLFVAGGNGVYLQNLTLLTDLPNAWSVGVFFPCVKQCGFDRLSVFGFTDGNIYLDLTWSDRNETLISLHPNIRPSSGMNEFSGFDFWSIAGDGGFALKMQGTTRRGSSVVSSSNWQWGWGGASDVRFANGRLTGTSSKGGEFSHDAQLFGEKTYAQGTTLRDIGFRGAGSGYAVKLDRSNRIIFDGCYAEEIRDGAHIFSVTSRTQASVDGIIRVNDKMNVPLYVDQTYTGHAGSTMPWSATRCVVTRRVDGRDWTPNLDSSRGPRQVLRLTSFATDGGIRLAYDDGSSSSDFLRIEKSQLRPEVGSNVQLGTTFAPFGAVHSGSITAGEVIRHNVDNTYSFGSAKYRSSVVYSGTSSISTSDERVKHQIEPIPDKWLDAWGDVEWCRYRFRDAVEKKGDGARWHVGLIAQRVRDVFASHELDAFEIGLLCFDKWQEDSEDEEVDLEQEGQDGDGNSYRYKEPVKTGRKIVIREAGDLYGLRYEEAFAMEAAWQRRELNRIKAAVNRSG